MDNIRKFWLCKHCGNLISYVKDVGVGVSCCGEVMHELKPNSTDAAQEKHVPVAVRDSDLMMVTVGSVPHPMTEEHYISWIVVADGSRTQRHILTPADKPTTGFVVSKDPVKVYAYCNLHGLWEATL